MLTVEHSQLILSKDTWTHLFRSFDDVSFLSSHAPCSPICSHVEEEEEQLREVAGPSSQADDDPEVTQFYVNPIAKPIPQGRAQTSLQDTISDLNMHKVSRNGLEVRTTECAVCDGTGSSGTFVDFTACRC